MLSIQNYFEPRNLILVIALRSSGQMTTVITKELLHGTIRALERTLLIMMMVSDGYERTTI